MTESIRWQSVESSQLSWRQWGDSFVVYQKQSGGTHMLNAAGHDLITRVLSRPHNPEGILQALGGPDDGLMLTVEDIVAMLSRFEQIGLVRSI